MKRKILPILSLMAAMTLVACGGNADKSAAKKSNGTTTKSTAPTSRHTHTYASEWSHDENQHWHAATCNDGESCATAKGSAGDHEFVEVADDARNVAATCSVDGVRVEKCSVCNYERLVNLGKDFNAHEFYENKIEEHSSTSLTDGTSSYYIQECKNCHKQDVVIDALDYTKLEGSRKNDVPAVDGMSLKLGANGNYAEYEFDLEGTLTDGTVALFGCVDHFADSNNNGDRGYKDGKLSDVEYNIEVYVNDETTPVTITNTKTYKEMGMTARDESDTTGFSTFALCELGAANLVKGHNKITYKRTDSYNLNVTEIHFVGKYTEDPAQFTWEADGAKNGLVNPLKSTTDENQKAYRLDVADAAGWNQPSTKMNQKDQTNANSKSTWEIAANAIPNGNYRIDVLCKMTSSGHTTRYWFNHALNGRTDNGNPPDAATEAPFRYFFELNGDAENPVNPTTRATWGEQGLSDQAVKTANSVVSKVAVNGLTSFALRHGDIGYSLIIESVILVAL